MVAARDSPGEPEEGVSVEGAGECNGGHIEMRKIDEVIAEWQNEVDAEAVILMERDGMSPGEAGDRARAVVENRRKQAAQDRRHRVEGILK